MMATHRWIKFWPQDWQDDECLKVCSLSARGLWIAMIGQMHKSKRYGYLLVNGRAPDAARLAAVIGNTTEKEVARLLLELESEGVFSKSDDGTIYSRRMVRDNDVAIAGKVAVEKRWANKDKPKPTPNRVPNRVKTNGLVGPPNSLEAEAEAEADRRRLLPIPSAQTPATKENGFNGYEEGKEVVGGWFWGEVWDRIVEAAQIDPVRWLGNEMPARRWLMDGIEPDTIIAQIQHQMTRAVGPIGSLNFFDNGVRDRHHRKERRA